LPPLHPFSFFSSPFLSFSCRFSLLFLFFSSSFAFAVFLSFSLLSSPFPLLFLSFYISIFGFPAVFSVFLNVSNWEKRTGKPKKSKRKVKKANEKKHKSKRK